MTPYYALVTISKGLESKAKDIIASGEDLNRDIIYVRRVLGKGSDPTGWRVTKTEIVIQKLGL